MDEGQDKGITSPETEPLVKKVTVLKKSKGVPDGSEKVRLHLFFHPGNTISNLLFAFPCVKERPQGTLVTSLHELDYSQKQFHFS